MKKRNFIETNLFSIKKRNIFKVFLGGKKRIWLKPIYFQKYIDRLKAFEALMEN